MVAIAISTIGIKFFQISSCGIALKQLPRMIIMKYFNGLMFVAFCIHTGMEAMGVANPDSAIEIVINIIVI